MSDSIISPVTGPTIIMVRDQLYDWFDTQRPSLSITDFDLVKTYYPKVELQNIVKPRVQLVSMMWAEDKISRAASRQLELPVQIGVHQHVTPTDTSTIDGLIYLVEELNRLCAKWDCSCYTWLRTEPMQDPNGTALGFLELHEKHLFQAVFTAYYRAAVC